VTRVATPVNFSLNLAEAAGPRASQVSRALIEAMADGQISDGDRLPSTRMLAVTFGLARSAVVSAYEELIAAGFLVARPGGHTFVEHGARAAALAGALGASLPPPAARQPGRASLADRIRATAAELAVSMQPVGLSANSGRIPS